MDRTQIDKIKNSVSVYVKENGAQEITGANLAHVLNDVMVEGICKELTPATTTKDGLMTKELLNAFSDMMQSTTVMSKDVKDLKAEDTKINASITSLKSTSNSHSQAISDLRSNYEEEVVPSIENLQDMDVQLANTISSLRDDVMYTIRAESIEQADSQMANATAINNARIAKWQGYDGDGFIVQAVYITNAQRRASLASTMPIAQYRIYGKSFMVRELTAVRQEYFWHVESATEWENAFATEQNVADLRASLVPATTTKNGLMSADDKVLLTRTISIGGEDKTFNTIDEVDSYLSRASIVQISAPTLLTFRVKAPKGTGNERCTVINTYYKDTNAAYVPNTANTAFQMRWYRGKVYTRFVRLVSYSQTEADPWKEMLGGSTDNSTVNIGDVNSINDVNTRLNESAIALNPDVKLVYANVLGQNGTKDSCIVVNQVNTKYTEGDNVGKATQILYYDNAVWHRNVYTKANGSVVPGIWLRGDVHGVMTEVSTEASVAERKRGIGFKDFNGSFITNSLTYIPNATSTEPGFMSAVDKSKLDALTGGRAISASMVELPAAEALASLDSEDEVQTISLLDKLKQQDQIITDLQLRLSALENR